MISANVKVIQETMVRIIRILTFIFFYPTRVSILFYINY